MYLQITNRTKSRFNQAGTTKVNLIKDLKALGWNIKDCTIKEIAKELLSDKLLKL